jgi:hypothetical protein
VHYRRLLWFTIMVFIGAVLGVFYGWVINPVRYVDTAPVSLRQDYKADYALMAAEIYTQENSLPLATVRLERLGASSALRAVQEAILVGQQLGYSQRDMELLAKLSEALSVSKTPTVGAPTP